MVRKTGPPILACGLGHGENSPVGCFLTRPFKSHKLQLKIKYSLPTMEKLYFILRKTGPPILACWLGQGAGKHPTGMFSYTHPFKSHKLQQKMKTASRRSKSCLSSAEDGT